VVNGNANWRDLVQQTAGLPYLSVLPAGQPSRRAADGVGDALRRILAEARDEYDLVICDAPPLLGFAESLQIAALVDGVVVVALAGQTERTAVASVLSNLKRLRANVIGLALNEVRADMSERYYYYGYYGNTIAGTQAPQQLRKIGSRRVHYTARRARAGIPTTVVLAGTEPSTTPPAPNNGAIANFSAGNRHAPIPI